MSRFFSSKILRVAEHRRRGSIVDDYYCRSCGYNLRGLEYGRICPECGNAVAETRGLHDILLAGSRADRGRWRTGLGIAAICVFVALVARILYFVVSAPGVSNLAITVYTAIGAINSVAWVTAVWLVTPAALLDRWNWLRRPRVAARVLAFMWIVGYACLILRYQGSGWPGSGDWLMLGDKLGRFLGGLGVMFVAFILHHVAEEAELEVQARRLNAVVWILWFPTLLAQVFPDKIAWFTLVPFAIVLFFWGWLMALLALGIRGLHGHVKWGGIHAIESIGREERVKETRAELQEQADAAIRPLPRLKGDVQPEPPKGPNGT